MRGLVSKPSLQLMKKRAAGYFTGCPFVVYFVHQKAGDKNPVLWCCPLFSGSFFHLCIFFFF